MAIYEVEPDGIRPVAETRFVDLGLKERSDLRHPPLRRPDRGGLHERASPTSGLLQVLGHRTGS